MKFPKDIAEANAAWGANCGPVALAAILEKSVGEVRGWLGAFEQRHYMTPTDMKAALALAGANFTPPQFQACPVMPKAWPDYGLVFVRWGGYESQPVAAQYRHTHWVAAELWPGGTHLICEPNAPQLLPLAIWEAEMPKAIQAEGEGNGTYFIRTVIGVERGKEKAGNIEHRTSNIEHRMGEGEVRDSSPRLLPGDKGGAA